MNMVFSVTSPCVRIRAVCNGVGGSVRRFHAQRDLPGRPTGFLGLLGMLFAAVAVTILPGCGDNDSCEQDYPPPTQITAAQSPYELSSLSSDLSIASVRWVNATSGDSGAGTVTQVQECVFLLGCGPWSKLVVLVSLIPGTNTVYRYHTSDGCEWRDDYLITLN
jgi:hypothetical protein